MTITPQSHLTMFEVLVLLTLRSGGPVPNGAAFNVACTGLQRWGFLDNAWRLTAKGIAACDAAHEAVKDTK